MAMPVQPLGRTFNCPGGLCYATGIRRRFPKAKPRILREFTRNGDPRKIHRKLRSIPGEFLSDAAYIVAQDPSQSRELTKEQGTDIASW
jgi:hypothetical protein